MPSVFFAPSPKSCGGHASKGDAVSKVWLYGEGLHSVMEKDDKWQRE